MLELQEVLGASPFGRDRCQRHVKYADAGIGGFCEAISQLEGHQGKPAAESIRAFPSRVPTGIEGKSGLRDGAKSAAREPAAADVSVFGSFVPFDEELYFFASSMASNKLSRLFNGEPLAGGGLSTWRR